MTTLTRGFGFKPIRAEDIPLKGSQARGSRYAATVGEFMRSGAQRVEDLRGSADIEATGGILDNQRRGCPFEFACEHKLLLIST